MSVNDLPVLNAVLNGAATVFIVAALLAIRAGRKRLHGGLMSVALVISACFLTSYLIYHYQAGHVRFAGEGWTRPVYFTLLMSHVVLAAVNLPMILLTVIPVLRGRFDKHRRIARWTAPVWLYVSVTGVLVYLMCYQWFGPPLTP
ncbi:MAG: DUF420 domain-containing protein [Verrucomicrobiales bacterium]|nr:DUF420 domain-containing protein [Verrucomicrobiales bacterium]